MKKSCKQLCSDEYIPWVKKLISFLKSDFLVNMLIGYFLEILSYETIV
jgi:hypothetical protein